MPRIKLNFGFRYDGESVEDGYDNWKELFDKQKDAFADEAKKVLDFEFLNDEGNSRITEAYVTAEEVSE